MRQLRHLPRLSGGIVGRCRHLDESQRALVAARLATLPNGVRVDRAASIDAPTLSQSDAAEMLNVSRKFVQRARQVLERATPAGWKCVN